MAKEKKDVNYRAMSIEKAEEKAYAENYKMQLKKIYEEEGQYAAAAFQVRHQLNSLGQHMYMLGKQIADLFANLAPKKDGEEGTRKVAENEYGNERYSKSKQGDGYESQIEGEDDSKTNYEKPKPAYISGNMYANRRREKRATNLVRHRSSRNENILRHRIGGLEKGVAVASFISFLISLFLFSGNITGNVVMNNSTISNSFYGVIFFVIGLIGVFFIAVRELS